MEHATKSYVSLVRRAKAKGYIVKLIFFWLNSPELAIKRVAGRVARGGLNIPEPVIRRRYVAGINNLFRLYINKVDLWYVYDNSEYPRLLVAIGGMNVKTTILEESLFTIIQDYVR